MIRAGRPGSLLSIFMLFSSVYGGTGCGLLVSGTSTCQNDDECSTGQRCQDGVCVVSSQAVDAGTADAPALDAAVSDSTALDAAAVDVSTPDVAAADGAAADGAAPDGAASDASASDLTTPDSTVLPDSSVADAQLADTSMPDSGAPSITLFEADPPVVEWGDTVVLRWQSSGADGCAIDGDAVSATSGSWSVPSVEAAHTFVLECANASVTVRREVEVTITCDQTSVAYAPSDPIISGAELEAMTATVSGCFSVVGLLRIEGSDLTDLSALAGLVEIRGGLEIHDNAGLLSLAGLESLQAVRVGGGHLGHLHIGRYDEGVQGNPGLMSLEALGGLREVEGNLDIEYNYELTGLRGLDELRSIGLNFAVGYSDQIEDLHGLGRLTSVGQTFRLTGLDGLTSLDGLGPLSTVGWLLRLEYIESLANIDALASLTEILGLSVVEAPQITALTPLQNLIEPMDRITLINTGLSDLDPLSGRFEADIRFIYIANNPALQQIDALSSVFRVSGDPVECVGWNRANHRCSGSVVIMNNPSLSSLSGLGNLNVVGVELHLENNSALTSLDGLDNLDSVGGSLTIAHHQSLGSFEALERLGTVGEGLTVSENPILRDPPAPADLYFIGGPLIISENTALTSLSVLANLEELGGDLVIAGNLGLEMFAFPVDVIFGGDDFIVRDNTSLPRQQACKLSQDWTGDDGCTLQTEGAVVYQICGNGEGAVPCP